MTVFVGPGRPPVARGESITAKLVFLEGALKHEQKRMKHVLQVMDDETQKREQQAQKVPQERLPDFILNTDFRAYERRRTEEQADAEGAGAQQQQQQQKDFSLLAKDPELRRKMMEQRKKMLEYGKRVNVVKGAPGIKPLNLPAIKSKVAATWKPEEHGNHADEEDGGSEANLWASPQPAEWRLRTHQARRRLFLLVGAIARWQLAMSRRPGPKRLPRVNSFSYFIPQESAVEPGLERVPPVDLSPPHYHRKKQQPQQPAVEALAEVPERLRQGRGPPRRGVSDSGCPATAAAAAAAVAAVDGEAAAAVAAGGGGDEARPKRKPELRKSSSGKCSSSSLPEALIPGHTSDVEAYGPPRRPCSGRIASTRLPAIGSGRMSASGTGASDVNSPQLVPRQPRGKLGRIPSGGPRPGGGRTRRQSDSSVAMAAAAAAGTALPATLAAGAATTIAPASPAAVIQRRGSAAVGVRSGAGWGSRGSDCGSMQRQRELSDAGAAAVAAGGGGGPLPVGARVSMSGGMPGATGSPRRSVTGQLLALMSAGSAPPDSPSCSGGGGGSGGGAGSNGGFLPRISSSNGVSGGGAGGQVPSPKPMTVAQARRLALLAEAGALVSGEDAAGRGNVAAASSPSRLGPLKLGNSGSGTPLGSGASRSPDKAASIAAAAAALACAGGGASGGSILDALCQARDSTGAPSTTTASPLALPLAAGGMRELREAMALANGGGGLPPGAPLSPMASPVALSSTSSDPPSNNSSGGGATSSILSSTTSTTISSSSAATAATTITTATSIATTTSSTSSAVAAAAAAAAVCTAAGPASAAGLPPLPPSKPPLGPAGCNVQPATAAAAAAAALPPPPPSPPLLLDPEASARLSKAQQLMGMYANRERFCASDAWVPYKVTVLRMLKAGAMAVHIDACADAVQLPDGTSMDVWTSDPWNLAQRLRPGSLPLSERIEGVSLGARVLQQLVLAVESLAGRDAVPKLTVVLAINDDQRNAVVADIIRTRSYGLKPENLILTAQRKRCGYRYDRDAQAFLEDPSTPAQVLGSGYSLCQLAWLGDAFSVTREGELAMLMARTLLERFAEQRVEWLHLAFSLYAADRHGGNMVVQAAPAASLTIPRAYDSTLLTIKTPPGSAGATGLVPTRVVSVAASAAGVESSGSANAVVVDLRAAELSSPVMVEVLAGVRKQAGHDGWVGLQRYLLHVPTLHAMLNTLGIFRPKLFMAGDVARLSLDAADITADRRLACVAVHARNSPAILTSPNEVDDLIPLLLAQDHSAAFRDIIAASSDMASLADAAAAAGGGGGDGARPAMVLMTTKPGIRILLYIAANEVTQLAVNLVLLMARPGRDVVHLVTVVHNSLQMPSGQALLLKYLKQISNAMIEAHSEVLVKGVNGLLEVMEGAASRLAPNLVVMASAALTMTNLNTASVMGSVTLSVLKRLTLPVAVATSNCKNLVLTQRRTALRCMVLVDPTSRPALNFLCSSCMEPMRGDKLVLAGHHPTRQMTTQQQQMQRRLIDNFGDISSSHRFHTPTKLQLDGPVDKALIAAAEDEAVHLVGLQVPLGTKGVPGHVLGLIRSCRAGVMVFRDTA
ncbi:hypothetical protein VOLCADRAFT_116765 [Volvox carteri f. nagariensis]|uniref:Uncharacterized protein n=1 Tax=Volvox carteri f. nagariensis TaxID=3068 RepID=D8TPB5_VOLCA|nr:uncharacterized protein VOLCADRAFT_116765 [Volvox carteri f. nagariensis]EFJ50592.1 hypothetical protein VOLCADRAFT_116765 [Volvox carteri f. nagariensis]|eukprot:XP_002948185.1 hypothetical protein VOLCADRAFT_116765 [Volvox carteri f. nagariensis]